MGRMRSRIRVYTLALAERSGASLVRRKMRGRAASGGVSRVEQDGAVAASGLGLVQRLVGTVHCDRVRQTITRFDALGVGRAWGPRSNEIRLDQYPWMYGIACELVTGDAPQDLIPPYNMLHYNPTGPYFER